MNRTVPQRRSARRRLARTGQMLALATVIGALVAGCNGNESHGVGPAIPTATPVAVPAAVTVQPVPSPGCSSPAAYRKSALLKFSNGTSAGDYYLDRPPATPTPTPTSVVVNLHGYLEPAVMQRSGSGLSRFGDAHGFITVTPEDTPNGTTPEWDFSPHSPDIAWISQLITHVEASQCVDERRIYVTGLSMGAFTSSAIACELSTQVAAVAPVAGVQAFPWCAASRAVPVVAFHGTADPYIAYTGGPGRVGRTLPVPGDPGVTIGQYLKQHPHSTAGGPMATSIPFQVATWAHRNGCGATPTLTTVASDVTEFVYPCPANASVDFYRVTGGGHTWPGGPPHAYPANLVGRTTQSISASAIMWAFFQAHPLTGPIAT